MSDEEEENDTSEDEHEEGQGSEPSRPTSPDTDARQKMSDLSITDSSNARSPGEGQLSPTNGSRNDEEEAEEEEANEEEEDAEEDLKTRVTSEIMKTRARQQRKYHSKKSVNRAGRAKGSKAKQDDRFKIDGGGW
jgi:RIO kinase 2